MFFYKRKALNLTEEHIRDAMKFTKSNLAAAAFLGCSYVTYKKYASMYFDNESGKTLWEIHKNKPLKGGHKLVKYGFKQADIFDILDGKHPGYDKKKLAKRLIDELIFEEKCANCGFDERRITDFKVPLILIWKDGDMSNHNRDNLEFVCPNCFFLTYADIDVRLYGAIKTCLVTFNSHKQN